MIDAYYFPYTDIASPVLEAFETFLQTVVLLRPSDQPVAEPLQGWVADGRVELRIPVQADGDQLQKILKNYQNWATLHRDDQGLRAAYFQSMKGHPPLYDQSATSKIRENIQSGLHTGSDDKSDTVDRTDRLMQARVFLSIAQQLDIQNMDLNDDLTSVDAMERRLFEQLHGEASVSDENLLASSATPGDQRLDHMIPERLVSWSLLFAEDIQHRNSDRIPVLITDSREAVDVLLGPGLDFEPILSEMPLPDLLSQEKKTIERLPQWQSILAEVAANPWPTGKENFDQLVQENRDAGPWRLTVTLVPGQMPEKLFGRSYFSQNGPAALKPKNDSTFNTVICLVQKAH